MVYVVSHKYLDKHIRDLVAPNEYIIFDGDNSGSNASDPEEEVISQKYNYCFVRGGFCPERETILLMRRKAKGKEYSEKKLKRQLKEFFKGMYFVQAAFTAMKAQNVYGDGSDVNVYVCLPTIVYKEIGPTMAAMIQQLSGIDFQFVFTQKDIKKDKKILEKQLKPKQLKKIIKVVTKAEKKFKIKCDNNDDDDDDFHL